MIIRNFEYLLALHQERHFSRAAVICSVSQPTLSSGIKQLEEDMRVQIVKLRARLQPDLVYLSVAVLVCTLIAQPSVAAGTNMPWEQPLSQILDSIQGPVAKVMSVIVIILTGLALAFGETSGGFRRLIQIVFGLSIAFAASSFFLTFFSFGGGALI